MCPDATDSCLCAAVLSNTQKAQHTAAAPRARSLFAIARRSQLPHTQHQLPAQRRHVLGPCALIRSARRGSEPRRTPLCPPTRQRFL
eukprot:1876835-Rhodomonas_salina.1